MTGSKNETRNPVRLGDMDGLIRSDEVRVNSGRVRNGGEETKRRMHAAEGKLSLSSTRRVGYLGLVRGAFGERSTAWNSWVKSHYS